MARRHIPYKRDNDRQPVSRPALTYLNRLSDLLFALARQANHRAGIADIPWKAPG